MIYLTVSLIILSLVILAFNVAQKNSRAALRERIRQSWGSPKRVDFNFHRIGRYAAILPPPHSHKLSKQTLDDIDFEQLFAFIDRTTSAVGQQFLYRHLLHPSQSLSDLKRRDELAHKMDSDAITREEIQEQLTKLDHPGAYNLCRLINLEPEEKPTWFRYLYLTMTSIAVLLILSFYSSVFLLLLLIPASINMCVHYWHRSRMGYSLNSYSELGLLIAVCNGILKRTKSDNQTVETTLRDMDRLKWKLFVLNPGKSAMKDDLSQFGFYINELINGIFLIEIMTVLSLSKALRNQANGIGVLFDFIGEVDTAISIASLRAGSKTTCIPEFLEAGKKISVKCVYHPLVKNCIRNDINIDSQSILITGSNMSGKTTFLRTMMINSILAQSIYTCFAEQFVTPFMRQFSSIRIDDNLFNGRSYFFEEVNVIGLFIEEMQSGHQIFFILDEVFRGTNSIERTALSKAVLSYLNQGNNIVIVSSHDIELADMLGDEYDVYHFTETIENRQLSFDHRLRPGPLRTGNAIRLLELGEFPEEITTEARNLSATRQLNGS